MSSPTFIESLRKNMVTILLTAAAITLIIGLGAGWFRGAHVLVGKPAPAFALGSNTGTEVTLAQHAGKEVVVLDFFATWCPPCREGLPHLADIAKSYEGKGVAVYAVNLSESRALVDSFMKEKSLDLNVLYDDGAVAERYSVSTIPQTVIIDTQGRVQAVHIGAGAGLAKTMRAEIDTLLAGGQLVGDAE